MPVPDRPSAAPLTPRLAALLPALALALSPLVVPHALVLPRLRLAQLATLLAGAWAVVGVDTGLVHLAAALDVPTVALYTDTDPQRTGVFPGRAQSAINLGGVGQVPAPASVLEALERLDRPPAMSRHSG